MPPSKLIEISLEEEVVAGLDTYAAMMGKVFWNNPSRSAALSYLLRVAPRPVQPNHFHGPSGQWPSEEEEEGQT